VPAPPEGLDASPWRRRGGYLVLVALAACQVWALYLYAPGQGPNPGHVDKLVHVALFAVPVALAVALRLRWVVTLLVLHALVSEPLQGLLTRQREADVWDTVADGIGIVIGVAVARRFRTGGDRLPTESTS